MIRTTIPAVRTWRIRVTGTPEDAMWAAGPWIGYRGLYDVTEHQTHGDWHGGGGSRYVQATVVAAQDDLDRWFDAFTVGQPGRLVWYSAADGGPAAYPVPVDFVPVRAGV